MAFKPKPTHVYREEVQCESNPLRNSTRQTFNPTSYAAWQRYWKDFGDRSYNEDVEARFFVGAIAWGDE